ncbi:MAG: sulfur oxidation c-type cytochrome SoxA [Gammaproteobacteria bacterium]|nr:sulfur oxidation c-type cytochrome SoxA [Gammaproteobacteria bacterium]
MGNIKFICTSSLALLVCFSLVQNLIADPQEDIKTYQDYFIKRFPKVEFQEFSNGIYAINDAMRENWEAMEEFPPYEPFIDDGKVMWDTAFSNGKSYAQCFPDGPGSKHLYPRWDKQQGQVVTLALAINQCRESNGEQLLKYNEGPIAQILSYMAWESRGKKTNVVVPSDDPRAMQAYEKGKEYYFTRRGQLNFACYHCHFSSSGLNLRADVLSTAVGQTTGWPVYRSKWGTVGTLHRRYIGCNKQVRAKPFKAQSEEYRNLEYFHSAMSNGIELNGPSSRK